MKKIVFIIWVASFAGCSKKQSASPESSGYVNVIAGNDTMGYSGNDGPAKAADIGSITGIVVDKEGNVYFNDEGNNCIREINTSGIIITVAGVAYSGFGRSYGDYGPATSAGLSIPSGLAIDNDENIYIADNRWVIRKVNSSGIIRTVAGIGAPGYNGDGGSALVAALYANQVALDASGNIYISDKGDGVIRKVNTSGIISTIAGNGNFGSSGDGGAATAAMLLWPGAIAIDNSGNIYIACGDEHIRKVDASGIITTVAGNGIAGYTGDGMQATATELNEPNGLALDNSGNLYISDCNNNRIRKVNSSGIISTVAGNGKSKATAAGVAQLGGMGGPATNAIITRPNGVAVDNSNNVYTAVGVQVLKIND